MNGTRIQPVQGDASCMWDTDQRLGLRFKEDPVLYNKVSEGYQDSSLAPKFELCSNLTRLSKANQNTKI